MTCRYTENISSWIDGELPSSELQIIESHLASCDECLAARSDFLTLRSELGMFEMTTDRIASRQALAIVLAKTQIPAAMPAQANWFAGLFGALRFKPVHAAVAILIAGTFLGLLLYRSIFRDSSPEGSQVAGGNSNRNIRRYSAPVTPSPTPSMSNVERSAKPTDGKRRKQKVSPPIELPRPPKAPDDLVSPWRNQTIATVQPEESPEVDLGASFTAAGSPTARHLGQSELLLRSFRNIRTGDTELPVEIAYERRRAQKLIYQNILLRREADAKGDVQVASLLDSLEPILLDIANLPARPVAEDVRAIKDRLERKHLVALLQINATALARANE